MNSRRRRAFTLIELLVVVAVIALLVALLVPAISRARLAAFRAVDLSQLRQVGIASAQHVSDEGVIPHPFARVLRNYTNSLSRPNHSIGDSLGLAGMTGHAELLRPEYFYFDFERPLNQYLNEDVSYRVMQLGQDVPIPSAERTPFPGLRSPVDRGVAGAESADAARFSNSIYTQSGTLEPISNYELLGTSYAMPHRAFDLGRENAKALQKQLVFGQGVFPLTAEHYNETTARGYALAAREIERRMNPSTFVQMLDNNSLHALSRVRLGSGSQTSNFELVDGPYGGQGEHVALFYDGRVGGFTVTSEDVQRARLDSSYRYFIDGDGWQLDFDEQLRSTIPDPLD